MSELDEEFEKYWSANYQIFQEGSVAEMVKGIAKHAYITGRLHELKRRNAELEQIS